MAENTCTVPGCDRTRRLKGMCGAHHQRLLRKGDVQAHIPLRSTDPAPDALWCSACMTAKPVDEFHRNAATRTGRDGVCKVCVTARRQRRRIQRALVTRAWRQRNAGSVLEAKRQWSLSHPRVRTQPKPRFQIKAQNANTAARKAGVAGHVTRAQLEARWMYFAGRCWMCGCEATDFDHVKPVAQGGLNVAANMRPACSPCNREKSNNWPFVGSVDGREPARRQGVGGHAA